MIEGSLARRYTKALFQLAREAGQEEAVGREVEEFFAAYEGSDLRMVLTNPAFDVATRKRILIQVANRQQLSVLTIHFLSLLLERDRLSHIAAIAACYRRLLNEAKGRVEAKVVSGELQRVGAGADRPSARAAARVVGQRSGLGARNRSKSAWRYDRRTGRKSLRRQHPHPT
jgi:hypothetical protein